MDIKVSIDTVIVFDLDDTLYFELDYLKSAYREIAMKLEPNNWELLFMKIFSLYRNDKNVFEFLQNEYSIEQSKLIELYRFHKPQISLRNGVGELISNIKENNGRVCIITDGRSITQRNKLESLRILEEVDMICISEEIGEEKPSLKAFNLIQSAYSDSTEFYYIGDNIKKDFIAPNLLGWKSVCILDSGLNIHNKAYKFIDNKNHLPNYYISNFEEININV